MSNNITKNHTIIGISPGTRILGVAIIKDHELLEWKVKTVNGKWSEQKHRSMLNYVLSIINMFEADTMVVKVFHESKISIGLKQLIESFKELARRKRCKYYTCTISDLKELYDAYDVRNKSDLMHAVVAKHPELAHARDKELKNRNRYYTKMFEAVACAHSCLKKQSR